MFSFLLRYFKEKALRRCECLSGCFIICLISSPSHIVSGRSLTAQPSSLNCCIKAFQFNHFTQYPHFLSLLQPPRRHAHTCLSWLKDNWESADQNNNCFQQLAAHTPTHTARKMCVDAWKHKLPWRNCGCMACVCVWTFSLSSLVSCWYL